MWWEPLGDLFFEKMAELVKQEVIIEAVKRNSRGCRLLNPPEAPHLMCDTPRDGRKILSITPLGLRGVVVRCQGCHQAGNFVLTVKPDGEPIEPVALPQYLLAEMHPQTDRLLHCHSAGELR